MKRPDINRLKIALLHYSCPHVVGGVEEVIRQQAALFHRLGHEVRVIAGMGNIYTDDFPITINPLFSSIDPSVIKAHQDLLKRGDCLRLDQLIEIMQVELLQELKSYDFLIAHNVMTMAYNLPLAYTLKNVAQSGKIRVISWNHDSVYFHPNCLDVYHDEPWNIIKTAFPFINYACISEQRREQFRELYNTDLEITVVPDSIEPLDFIRVSPQLQQLIRERRLYEADLVMVHPTRLIPRKNIELGLRVVQSIKKRGVKVRYIVTGSHDPHEPKNVRYYRNLKEVARELDITQEAIFITDYKLKSGENIVPDQKFIRDLYLVADLLLVPSISEGFGLPLLEAGLLKLPIACSDILPFTEIGGDYVCTFSHTDNQDSIAGKILRFLEKLATHTLYRKVINNYTCDSIYQTRIKPMFMRIIDNTYKA